MPQRHTISALIATLACVCPNAGRAELWPAGDPPLVLAVNPTLKLTGLSSLNPDDARLYPRSSNTTGMFRLRLDLHSVVGDIADARIAYELGGRWFSHSRSRTADSGVLPLSTTAPFRVTQLADDVVNEDRGVAVHELDRALLSFHPAWGEVTIGRQAIGLGRGVLFSAVDMFSPFTTLEADREWRRGVDAARVEFRLSETTSTEAIAVAGETWEGSALLIRLRGYFGPMDAEVIAGKRGRDEVIGTVLSATVADAEIHAELAVFHTPEDHPDGTLFGNNDYVPKAVLGASYTLGIGNGLTVLLEYHYSGFGARHTDEAQDLFAIPEYAERLRRGDSQPIGRHACGMQISYPISESLNATLATFASPTDGSGIVSPALRWDLSRAISFTTAAYVPWGQPPTNGRIESEYGSSPTSLFAQLGMYF